MGAQETHKMFKSQRIKMNIRWMHCLNATYSSNLPHYSCMTTYKRSHVLLHVPRILEFKECSSYH